MNKKIYVMFLSLTNFINFFSMGEGGGSSNQGNYGGSNNYGSGGGRSGTQGSSRGSIFGSSATGAQITSQNLLDQSATYDTKGGKVETKQEENEGKFMVGATAGYFGHKYSKDKAAKEMEAMKANHEKEMGDRQKELDETNSRLKNAENKNSERNSRKYTSQENKNKRKISEDEEEF